MIAAAVLALLLAADDSAVPPPKLALDVVVRGSKGQTVERLAPSDLVVTESGQPLSIESVRFVRPTPSEPRDLAIFLDEFHVQPGPEAARVRDTLARFVSESLTPADRLAVLKPLDSLLDIAVTTDRAAALAAIESFTPRANDLSARTAFERSFIATAPDQIVASRAQIATSSLTALSRTLGALGPGRKTLIVVSDGFSLRRTRRGESDLPGLEAVAASANRAQVSIYPIVLDTSSDATNDRNAAVRDLLGRMAVDTAGAVVPLDRIDSGLRAAMDDASGYYEVTLRDALPPSVRLHALQVSATRRDLVVRARSGYGGPSAPASELSVVSVPRSRLPAIARRTSPLIRPWFGVARNRDGSAEVSFAWEPAPRPAGERVRGLPPARIQLNVVAEDGRTLFDGVVAASNASLAGSTAPPTRIGFPSPSGRLLVQMAIEDAAATVIDRDVRDVLVEPLTAPLVLGTPEVFRARTARERDALLGRFDVAPSASRLFSRAERLIVRVPVSASTASPSFSARLVSDLGGSLRTLDVSRIDGHDDVLQLDVPLAALAAGGYAIEVTARENGHETSERLQFRVTP